MPRLLWCWECKEAPCECREASKKPFIPNDVYYMLKPDRRDGIVYMNVSGVHGCDVISQVVDEDGKLVVTFGKSKHWFYPAGTITCEPYRGELDELAQAYDEDMFESGDHGHCMILSATVTRCGSLFYDKGVFVRTSV